MPGTVVRVKGIKRYFEPKTGKTYCYYRASGKRIKEEFGSPEFFTRLAELDKEIQTAAEDATRPGTLKALILSYKNSTSFRDLAPRSRGDYDRVFTFLEPLWDVGVDAFTTPQIVKLRDKWCELRGRRFVNYTRTVLSILFGHAIEIGVLSRNPVADVKPIRQPRNAVAVNRPWTLIERRVALKYLPIHLKLPVALGLFSGMREGDVIGLPVNAVQFGRINIKTAKRGIWIDIPVVPELRKIILEFQSFAKERGYESTVLCLNSKGTPWTLHGFSSSFRKELKKLEAEGLVGSGLTFHGLRHTVATVLAESGVSAEDIAAVLGQRSSQMASHYSREADRSRRTRAAIEKFRPLNGASESSDENKD